MNQNVAVNEAYQAPVAPVQEVAPMQEVPVAPVQEVPVAAPQFDAPAAPAAPEMQQAPVAPTATPSDIPPTPVSEVASAPEPVVADFNTQVPPTSIEVKEQEPVVPNINFGIEEVEEEAPIMDASFPVDIPEAPTLKQVDDKTLTETKELPDGPEEFKLEVPEAPEFTTTQGTIDSPVAEAPAPVVSEEPQEFTLDLEADVAIDPSANLSTENVDNSNADGLENFNFEAMQAEADQHDPSAEIDFELKLDDEPVAAPVLEEQAAPATEEIEGLQGVDLAVENEAPQMEGLNFDSQPAAESSEEQAMEGLDFSAMLKEEESSDDFGVGGPEIHTNITPPSAHLVPDEAAPMPSSLDVAEVVSEEPLKVAHPEAAPAVEEAPVENLSDHVPVDASEEERIGYKALSDFSQYFDRVMILQPNQMLLKPSLWQGNWHYNKNSNANIDITMSSIFRIVFTSKKPYHGYVVRNQINDSFFNTFNQGELPDHATIVPVMIDNNLVGMILGFTDQHKADFVNLEDCERIAEKYASELLEFNKSQLQAA